MKPVHERDITRLSSPSFSCSLACSTTCACDIVLVPDDATTRAAAEITA